MEIMTFLDVRDGDKSGASDVGERVSGCAGVSARAFARAGAGRGDSVGIYIEQVN